MKLFVMLFASVLFTATSYAASKQEVSELLRLNRQALLQTEVDSVQLDEVASLLESALFILEGNGLGGGSIDQKACLDFATEQYKAASYSPATAMEKAMAICKTVKDVKIVKFRVEKYKAASYSPASAMEKATQATTDDVRGKFDIVEYATEKYIASSYSPASSFEKAIGVAKNLSKNAFPCFQTAVESYIASSYNPASAVEKAVLLCK